MNNLANRFMGGRARSTAFSPPYLKRWCKLRAKQLVIREYDAFMRDTRRCSTWSGPDPERDGTSVPGGSQVDRRRTRSRLTPTVETGAGVIRFEAGGVNSSHRFFSRVFAMVTSRKIRSIVWRCLRGDAQARPRGGETGEKKTCRMREALANAREKAVELGRIDARRPRRFATSSATCTRRPVSSPIPGRKFRDWLTLTGA